VFHAASLVAKFEKLPGPNEGVVTFSAAFFCLSDFTCCDGNWGGIWREEHWNDFGEKFTLTFPDPRLN